MSATTILYILIVAAAAAGVGIALGYFIRKAVAQSKVNSLEARADKILNEAKSKEQELMLHAREKALKVIDDAKHEEQQRRNELSQSQQRLEKRETLFDQKLLELQEKAGKLQEKAQLIEKTKTQIEQIRDEQTQKLQGIAQMSKEEAKDMLIKNIETQASEDLSVRMMKLDQAGEEAFEQKAKNILSTVIYRYAGSHVAETTTTSVHLPNDEMKGRIIGKEGRNIKTIEKLTGCELIVDDTPEEIMISAFSPIRRQVARIALQKLIADGRIHPARIEEVIEEAKKELALDLKKTGETALYELGLPMMDPKLVSIIGRLKYRTSFGQNNLVHSTEVAYISAMLAAELGADPVIAKKAGFLHDIGKAIDHETQGGHPELGYQLLKKFGFPEEIAYCCIAHHEDKPKTLLGAITKAADAISGARPGARRDTYEQYVHRLEELEKVATSFTGIEKAYAIQAGREVRVFVKPQEVDDYGAYNLAKDIARKIEAELNYPGEVKITVIREARVIEYAR